MGFTRSELSPVEALLLARGLTSQEAGDGHTPGKPAFQSVPGLDVIFALLPAQEHQTAIFESEKIYQTLADRFRDTTGFEEVRFNTPDFGHQSRFFALLL